MDDKEIEKIAQAIAAKIAEPGGNQLLGCGSASSTSSYRACYNTNYTCGNYECGGAANYTCGAPAWMFTCSRFRCYTNFTCYQSDAFQCGTYYNA